MCPFLAAGWIIEALDLFVRGEIDDAILIERQRADVGHGRGRAKLDVILRRGAERTRHGLKLAGSLRQRGQACAQALKIDGSTVMARSLSSHAACR